MANVLSPVATLSGREGQRSVALLVACLVLAAAATGTETTADYDRDTALALSQTAIGRTIGDHALTNTDGDVVRLSQYRGKPLLISMVFTSCHHICPTTTQHLAIATASAEEVLGKGSFNILTIGFDAKNDSPTAMRAFARGRGIDKPNWYFLSAAPKTIAALSKEIGFQFFPSPRGFDHLIQTTLLDRDGELYAQVYGMQFELPWLMEPLKQLVLNRPESIGHPLSGLLDRVRLFCTVYNPATGRYEFDNSLFFQVAAGLLVILSIAFFLWRELRRSRSR